MGFAAPERLPYAIGQVPSTPVKLLRPIHISAFVTNFSSLSTSLLHGSYGQRNRPRPLLPRIGKISPALVGAGPAQTIPKPDNPSGLLTHSWRGSDGQQTRGRSTLGSISRLWQRSVKGGKGRGGGEEESHGRHPLLAPAMARPRLYYIFTIVVIACGSIPKGMLSLVQRFTSTNAAKIRDECPSPPEHLIAS